MNKVLIATIVFNSNKITNECFIKSLYKHTDQSLFNLLIVTTSETEFVLDDQYKKYTNIFLENYAKKYRIVKHGMAIQKILDTNKNKYDDIIICENDVIVKQNLLNVIDHNVQFAGQDSTTVKQRHWWSRLYQKLKLGCHRYMPMLMYFNVKAFKDKPLYYDIDDCTIKVDIPTLNVHFYLKDTHLCDPGWYFMIFATNNNINCKQINMDDYISHFWYGSENRDPHNGKTYNQRLEEFKQENSDYL